MFNSFIDGTKSAIEMAAVANATGLTPSPEGLGFPRPPGPTTWLRSAGPARTAEAPPPGYGGGRL